MCENLSRKRGKRVERPRGRDRRACVVIAWRRRGGAAGAEGSVCATQCWAGRGERESFPKGRVKLLMFHGFLSGTQISQK